MIASVLGLLSALVLCGNAEKPSPSSPATYQIGFKFEGHGDPENWKVSAMTIRKLTDSGEDHQEFQTVASLKLWIEKMQPNEMLFYDAGCVVPSHLPVGDERISIRELKKVCAARQARFKIYGSW